MMILSDRVSLVQSSITLEMTERAARLQAADVDVINLSVGEPDFTTPGLSCWNPAGALYVFLSVSGLFVKIAKGQALQTPRDVTEYPVRQEPVITISGEGFGDQEHIRLSYAVSAEDIIAAIERTAAALARLN
ncbi:MAG: hypothetical protein ACETWG_01695 [Candidatus Neomarinimicrobiota bacterium]